MHRPHRSAEELYSIFEEHPTLGVLFYTLKMNPKLDVWPDGTGNTVFKVYLHGKNGAKEAFLQIAIPGTPSSYVDWNAQLPCCRKIFASSVKGEVDNPDGSYVKSGLILELVGPVQEYADEATK